VIRIFPMRGCSVCARKRDKLYIGECVVTIGLRGIFDLCIFSSPYSLGGREFISFNFDLVLLGMLLFSTKILIFCVISWIKSLSRFCMLCPRESSSSFFIVCVFVITVVLPLSEAQ